MAGWGSPSQRVNHENKLPELKVRGRHNENMRRATLKAKALKWKHHWGSVLIFTEFRAQENIDISEFFLFDAPPVSPKNGFL